MADSEDLQAKVGKEITGDTLVALGAAHGCEFSIEDVQASVELSDHQMEGISSGVFDGNRRQGNYNDESGNILESKLVCTHFAGGLKLRRK